jgi:hypothetical protein
MVDDLAAHPAWIEGWQARIQGVPRSIFPGANRRPAQTAIECKCAVQHMRGPTIEATPMKLLIPLFVIAVISVAGAAAALTASPSVNSIDGASAQICTMSGYMMYCN